MEWTVETIRELCIEYCNKCGVNFASPIIINARITTTLGRCFSMRGSDNKWYPFKLEFSKTLLETATDDCIKSVIMHECAHYVATAITKESHGHDNVFKMYCAMIGTTNDGSHFFNLERKANVDKNSIYRYTLYCKKCGDFLGGYQKQTKVTRNHQIYRSNCCHSPIAVLKNW